MLHKLAELFSPLASPLLQNTCFRMMPSQGRKVNQIFLNGKKWEELPKQTFPYLKYSSDQLKMYL